MHVDQRLELLEMENARLREEVLALRKAPVADVHLPVELRLTPAEQTVVGHLLAREVGTKQSILDALYFNDIDAAEAKIVDVFVCKARKKLRPFAIEIETLWGVGYRLPPDSKLTLKTMCEAA